MGHGNASEKPDSQRQPEEEFLIVKWRRESGTPAPGQEDRTIRGKVIDVRGRTIGLFAGLDSLFQVLTKITAEKPPPDPW